MKIAILYICTGNYSIFWKDFYSSCEKNFIPDSKKHYFVFTDSDELLKIQNMPQISVFYQKSLGWPDNTLLRYDMFLNKQSEFDTFDYVFFFNANMLFVEPITGVEFLPTGINNLVGALHSFFYNKPRRQFPFEKRRASLAQIDDCDAKYYFQGAINGGKTREFLEAIRHLSANIRKDLSRNIVAVWHDESHWNKYLSQRNDVRVLSPSYMYPEGVDLPLVPKILLRRKSGVQSLKTIRGQRESILSKQAIKTLFKKTHTKLIYSIFEFMDLIKCSLFFVRSNKFFFKRQSNDPRKISIAITTYKREKIIHKALKNIIYDDRVSEIIILDDGSPRESFDEMSRVIETIGCKKVIVKRRDNNLGVLPTKIEAISLCSNKWVILLDSDNTIMPSYIDAIYSMDVWDDKTIYSPAFAYPLLDFRGIGGRALDFSSTRDLLIKSTDTAEKFLNDCNFFINKDRFLKAMDKYKHSNVFAADSVFMNYIWLTLGNFLFILPKAKYIHRIHNKSIWVESRIDSGRLFESIRMKFLLNERQDHKL